MHELGPEPNFNESMYFNVFDPEANLGGFFRLGNRANEGRGEMTVCIYLPDGSVAFMFQRPKVTSNDAFDAAGMRFEVARPFEELRVRYQGSLVILKEPLQMADPKEAFVNNPWVPCKADLVYRGCSAVFGGEPDQPSERPGEEFARGHYEQLVSATGAIEIDGTVTEVSGFGLRDHSWGPRYWQAPWYYRWLTANFGSSFGFMGSRIARRDSDGIRSGFVWDEGKMHVCESFQISSKWDSPDSYHREIDAVLATSERTYRVKGEVINLIPLRNRRVDPRGNELMTRISEGLTRWRLQDGRIGYGWSEYLDQIVDGQPVGLAE